MIWSHEVGRLTRLLKGARAANADVRRARNKALASVEELEATDYFGTLVSRARAVAAKASVRFPQPNYVTLKVAEEAGEVVRGCVHFAEHRMEWTEVEGEIVQLLAMLIRLVTEGDDVNGVHPPSALPSLPPMRVLHVDRGTVYTVVGEAELQSSGGPVAEGAKLTVYRGADGNLWVRPSDEFSDGRFTVTPPTGEVSDAG